MKQLVAPLLASALLASLPVLPASSLADGKPNIVVILVDIMATCVDVSDAAYPREFQGKPIQPMKGVSLRPALAIQSLDRKQPLFFEHEGNRGIRDGDWKLVALGPDGPWELYHLKSDRSEQQDLAAQHPDKARQLVDQWEAWARRAHAIPWIWKPVYGESAQPGQAPEKLKKKAKRKISVSSVRIPTNEGVNEWPTRSHSRILTSVDPFIRWGDSPVKP